MKLLGRVARSASTSVTSGNNSGVLKSQCVIARMKRPRGVTAVRGNEQVFITLNHNFHGNTARLLSKEKFECNSRVNRDTVLFLGAAPREMCQLTTFLSLSSNHSCRNFSITNSIVLACKLKLRHNRILSI